MRLSFHLLCFVPLCAGAFLSGSAAQAQPSPAHVWNPGFEQVQDQRARGWQPFEQGYEVDTSVRRGGARSVRCVNRTAAERRGAAWTLTLNQKAPAPLLVAGWSRAEGVSGSANGDYSLYIDLTYTDGTDLWGQVAPFATGTHDWQRRQVLITPAKPIRSATVYALFRNHTGTAWFDDVSATVLTGNAVFDSQPVAAPRLPAGQTSGWFARDVAAGSPILPFGSGTPRAAGSEDRAERLGLRLEKAASGPEQEARVVADTTGKPRAITVYYVERFDAPNRVWWNDIRQKFAAGTVGERANLTRIGNVGANGLVSLYPFGCVTGGNKGRMVGVPPLLGPRIVRIGYHAGAKLLYVAFDVALTGDNRANRDARGNGRAKVAVVRAGVDPAWGFRAAAANYYRRFPAAFERRAKAEGIWIPFTDPSSVTNVQDFGIAYHEGDNSVAGDDKRGILSFRYTEPMTWWMPMPKGTPRSYEAALAMVRQHATGTDETNRRWAQAVLHSGSHDEHGKFNVEFQNAPWADGAVWALNPNPRLPHPPGEWTKASLNYTKTDADRRYAPGTNGVLDGEYLDSIEGWADVLDYRPETLRFAQAPPSFATDTGRPVVPTWFSVYEATAFLQADLRRRGKLLMANSTPWRFHAFLPLLDVAGTETNWLSVDGKWQPDPDALFSLRRTLCYHKPYLLLQNTDFDRFGPQHVRKYFQRSMFYGVYPSMFSVDAANRPYWQEPRWYDRDRALFKQYIPAIRRLSAAGWEPVTHARSNNPRVYVERFGQEYLTVLNDSGAPARAVIALDTAGAAWGGRAATAALRVVDLVTGELVARVSPGTSGIRLTVALGPEEGRAFRLTRAAATGAAAAR
uniref:CBM-cenC domain-containing protein n=1 Tax=uncultured Armatimonadetes bacterium TaxID=157466 RepID=A0A6J4JC56_9BACT|nr:hypothetical protein AVDCRST_MAG63-3258 [uncultured Armatimonadetes bacterium]